MRTRRRICLLICFILCALLAGCAGEPGETTQGTTVPVTTAPPAIYTVRFYYQDQVVHQEQVQAGGSPSLLPTIAVQDQVIGGWLDAQGNFVDPQSTAVQSDCDYTAAVYPLFSAHVPYLFPDERGYIHPDDILTGGEMRAALEALAPDGETLAAVSFPSEQTLVTKDALAALLADLFPNDKLEKALFNMPQGEVTRGDFARLMNSLLGRYANELLIVEDGQTLPGDLGLDRADADDILEAALVHTVTDSGYEMLDAVLEITWQPGFTNLGGWLYYADESGVLLRNGQLGTLTFGPDGRYTSGDAELDAVVAERVAGFIAENPEAERYDLLYTAFLHCRDGYRYVGRGLLEPGETGWEIEWAKEMFEKGAGNCYSYAAIFWAVARGLGYDAYCISGFTAEDYEPHGWVQIDMDGEPHIFDPELAMAFLRDDKNYKPLFDMEYAVAVQWPYFWP